MHQGRSVEWVSFNGTRQSCLIFSCLSVVLLKRDLGCNSYSEADPVAYWEGEMRKFIVNIAMLVFVLVLTAGCTDSSKQELGNEKSIGIRKQHDTRVFLLCKDSRGEYYEKSLHKSAQVTCGGKTFKIEEFATSCK
jgi:hypothetical protein